jgi:hypothetical protein
VPRGAASSFSSAPAAFATKFFNASTASVSFEIIETSIAIRAPNFPAVSTGYRDEYHGRDGTPNVGHQQRYDLSRKPLQDLRGFAWFCVVDVKYIRSLVCEGRSGDCEG